ncbi:MAG: hypothetical protein K2J72_05530, partial [Oscillospiraceae bacterium]|nr:hypothetical protein [Oscillospiraceae bacterium]
MRNIFKIIICAVLPAILFSACGSEIPPAVTELKIEDGITNITAETADKISRLESGLTAVKYTGDYKFAEFLESGGAQNDSEVIGYIAENLLSGADYLGFAVNGFGCSTVSIKRDGGGFLFGRYMCLVYTSPSPR